MASVLFLFCILRIPVLAADQDKAKIIYFILDDSGSMVTNKSRWIAADYAIKALVATMDENDMFYIANMGQYIAEDHEEVTYHNLELESASAGGSWMKESSASYNNLVYTDYANYTCKHVLEIVKEDIKNKIKAYPEDQYEYWIVWMTDGEIDCAACKREENVTENFSIDYEKLNNWKGDCQASLIHISINDSKVETAAYDDERIWMISAAADSNSRSHQSILEAVTEAGNYIYNRMKYQKVNAPADIEIDIPVSKLLVLEQFAGNPTEIGSGNEDFQTLMNELSERIPDRTVEIINKESDMEESETIYFSGRTTIPKGKRSFPTEYQALIGQMYRYDRAYQTGDNCAGATELSLAGNNAYYEVYYEPDLNVNPVFILENDEYKLGADNKFVLEEGKGTLEIRLEDLRGNSFNAESELLHLDQFDVKLLADDGEQVALERTDMGEGLIYNVPELSRGKYTFFVKTSWGEAWDYAVSVEERKLPIEICRINEAEIVDPKVDSIISFSIAETGGDTERNLLIHASAFRKEDDKKWNYKLLRDENDSSIWNLEVSWYDETDHVCAQQVEFSISAVREYEDGSSERTEKPFVIDVKASFEEVEAIYEDTDDKYYYPWEVKQALDTVTYKCGSVLTPEQEKLISGKLCAGEDTDRFCFENGRVEAANYMKWISMKRHEAVITGKVHYPKWNRDDEGEWSVIINIKPIPIILVIFGGILVILLLIWIIYVIFKPFFEKKYITNHTRFFLKYEGDSTAVFKVSFGGRIVARCLPFRNWKKYKIDGGGQRLGLDDIVLKMRKGSGPETWVVVNPSQLPETCGIGEGKVSERNFVIGEYKPFTMKDKGGHIWTLCWEQKNVTGGRKL